MTEEIWKVPIDRDGKEIVRYEISNMGNLRMITKTYEYKYINGSYNAAGYKKYMIDNVNQYCQHIVMYTHYGPRPNRHVIKHIDNDRSNNNIDNLHYVAYRADILEKNPIKRQRVIIKQCICGSDITSNNFNTHLKSRKHQNYNSSE